ncbi:hypothetical protein VaNZ11_007701, partial [Volvox africanus]
LEPETAAEADGGVRRTRQRTGEGAAAHVNDHSANQGVAGVGGTVTAPRQVHTAGGGGELTEAGGPQGMHEQLEEHQEQEQQQHREQRHREQRHRGQRNREQRNREQRHREQRHREQQREHRERNAAPSGSGPQPGAQTTATVAGRTGVAGPAPSPGCVANLQTGSRRPGSSGSRHGGE